MAGAGQAFGDFIAVDDNVPTCDPQTVTDIVAVSGDEDEEEDEPKTAPASTFARAIAALDVLQSYFNTKGNPADAAKGTLSGKSQGMRLQKLTDISER